MLHSDLILTNQEKGTFRKPFSFSKEARAVTAGRQVQCKQMLEKNSTAVLQRSLCASRETRVCGPLPPDASKGQVRGISWGTQLGPWPTKLQAVRPKLARKNGYNMKSTKEKRVATHNGMIFTSENGHPILEFWVVQTQRKNSVSPREAGNRYKVVSHHLGSCGSQSYSRTPSIFCSMTCLASATFSGGPMISQRRSRVPGR